MAKDFDDPDFEAARALAAARVPDAPSGESWAFLTFRLKTRKAGLIGLEILPEESVVSGPTFVLDQLLFEQLEYIRIVYRGEVFTLRDGVAADLGLRVGICPGKRLWVLAQRAGGEFVLEVLGAERAPLDEHLAAWATWRDNRVQFLESESSGLLLRMREAWIEKVARR